MCGQGGLRRFRAVGVQIRGGRHGVFDGRHRLVHGALLLRAVHQTMRRAWRGEI